jgi:hypothetical protein
MRLQVREIELFTLEMRTRMPFRYGIAMLEALPHLFLRATVEVNGKPHIGLAADHLPPKWFTKNPATSPQQDIDEILAVIRSACAIAKNAGAFGSVFDLWRAVYHEQLRGSIGKFPPLLANFGVTLIERAVIDAFCRATTQTFAAAVRENSLGIRLGELHEELDGAQPAQFLSPAASRSLIVRHTVGLSDPLAAAEVPAGDASDGLPRSLEACVREYGLTHFKIKLSGDAEQDTRRLRDIGQVLGRPLGLAVTLDGNENYRDVAAFRDFWERSRGERVLEALLLVEQPIHRDAALSSETAEALLGWPDRPAMIIDESDDHIDSVRRALECGYAGASFKSCKGVIKGIANACLLARRNGLLTAEDLSTVGPVSLMQDLAVIATLGIGHAERNGHHYFRGLSAFPQSAQQQVLAAHGDLYRDAGFATLNIRDGSIALGSVIDAPFGVSMNFDPSIFSPLPL